MLVVNEFEHVKFSNRNKELSYAVSIMTELTKKLRNIENVCWQFPNMIKCCVNSRGKNK